MKLALLLFCFVFGPVAAAAQLPAPVGSDLQRLVETEKAFAKTAAEKGTKQAFLEFLADDGVVFNPTEANGKLVWQNRPESPALLAWNPAWADVSADGSLGYTTGGWEYRPKGRADRPAAFGEYVTLWQKQADGGYKAILDIGISHPFNSLSNGPWKSPKDAGTGPKTVKTGLAADILNQIFSNKSMANGYFNFLADDCLVLRDGNLPFAGKQAAFVSLEKLDADFPPTAFLDFEANTAKIYGNLTYVSGLYKLTAKDNSVKKWNFVQIWKHRAGKWQIVLDIFNPIPVKK